jgi:hypothetical protein
MENWHGVYVSHATQLRISGIQISIANDGSTDIGEPKTHLLTWMFVYWLEIAFEHLQIAELAHAQLLEKWVPGEPAEGSTHLRAEFSSSMQSINAAAIAVDAFYAAIKNAYRASNAHMALEYVLKLIVESLSRPKDNYSGLVELCSSCRDLVSPVKASWVELYGPLIMSSADQARQHSSAAQHQDPTDGNKDV